MIRQAITTLSLQQQLPAIWHAAVALHSAAPWCTADMHAPSAALGSEPSTPSAAMPYTSRPTRLWRGFASTAEAAQSGIILDDSAVQRLQQLQQQAGPNKEVLLRVEVEGGGCSGFQYKFKLDSTINPDDKVFEKGGARIVTDAVSLEFLRGAVIEFEDSLMRSAFQVAANPNSESTCGCGSSFVAKG